MRRHALIVARADVAVALRSAIVAELGVASSWLAAAGYRRTTDVPGVATHYAAHGYVPDQLWPHLVAILDSVTAGVRDSTDWQGKPQTPIADARWAVALDGVDLVAAYRLSEDRQTMWESPHTMLQNAGLVPVSADASDGIGT